MHKNIKHDVLYDLFKENKIEGIGSAIHAKK